MKKINDYIKEGLKIGSKTKIQKSIKIDDKEQLKQEILKRVNDSQEVLDLTDLDISKLADLSDVFADIRDKIEKFRKIDVSGWNTSNCKTMKKMFFNCRYLQEVIGLDTWDVSNITDMSFMFDSCINLKNIGDLSSWEINDTKMHATFYNCAKLKTIGPIKHWRPSESNWDIFALSDIKPMPTQRV